MKLLLLTRSLNQGGAERQLITLAKALARGGRTLTVAVFYAGGVLENELARAGVPVHNLGKRGRWDVGSFFMRARKYVRQEQPDIIYSMLPSANLLAVGLKPFSHPLRVVWGVRASRLQTDNYDLFNAALLALQRAFCAKVEHIIVNSHAGKRDLVEAGYNPALLTVIPNGVDLSVFARDKHAGARLREEWGVSDRECLVGLPARFDPMKDHRTFLAAAARVAAQRSDVRFVCIGGGDQTEMRKVQEFATKLGVDGRIIWAGPRSDMSAVYSAVDLCVLSSAYGEGFPNVLVEALACGTPCISTDVGDAGIILAGVGLIVPPRDQDALAGAVLTMLETNITPHERERLRSEVSKRFSVARMVRETEQVLYA